MLAQVESFGELDLMLRHLGTFEFTISLAFAAHHKGSGLDVGHFQGDAIAEVELQFRGGITAGGC